MGRYDDSPKLPARVQAAFDFLYHARHVTEQCDASIPARNLTSLEKSVELASLRVIHQYLLGEMDFRDDSPEAATPRKGENDDDTPQLASTPH